VIVLVEGRPRILPAPAIQGAAAIVHAILPCLEGGQAIAEVLFGVVNPSGRLPFTYVAYPTSMPLQYWHVNSQVTNSPGGVTVQWPFGQGLSYTQFEYSSLRLSSNQVTSCDLHNGTSVALTVETTLTNSGKRAGAHSVLLFLQDQYRIIAPEAMLLKGFQKLFLKPGDSQDVTFELRCEDFAFYGINQEQLTLESGGFTVYVGDQQADFELTVDMPVFSPTYWNRRK